MSDERRETIEHWVGDFVGSSRFVDHPSLVREYAPEVLVAFLSAACAVRGVEPADVEEGDLRAGMLEGVARLDVPGSVREAIPPLCAAFLEEMEAHGRLSGGRTLGLYVRALAEPYLAAAAGKPKPFVAAAEKIGRNDPCPCGSGRKYKRCCGGGTGS